MKLYGNVELAGKNTEAKQQSAVLSCNSPICWEEASEMKLLRFQQ